MKIDSTILIMYYKYWYFLVYIFLEYIWSKLKTFDSSWRKNDIYFWMERVSIISNTLFLLQGQRKINLTLFVNYMAGRWFHIAQVLSTIVNMASIIETFRGVFRCSSVCHLWKMMVFPVFIGSTVVAPLLHTRQILRKVTCQ
jgi:hypothetical protein